MQIIGIYQKNINKTSEILQLSSVKGDEIKKRSHLRCAFLYRLDVQHQNLKNVYCFGCY